MTEQESGYYISFNARSLSPEAVATTFIYNSHFERLLGNEHTLLIGPRGSGKTTLLKMLSQRALRGWTAHQSADVNNRIPFVGVYIPADVIWQKQLERLEAEGGESPIARNLAFAMFATNTLKSFATAMADRLEYERSDTASPIQETTLWKCATSSWRLDNCIPAAVTIIRALGERLNHLTLLARKLTDGTTNQFTLPEYVFLDPITAIVTVLDCTEGLFRHNERRWALCYDELEILAPSLRTEILGHLRSTDQRLLFKLSTSPFKAGQESVLASFQASWGNDFNVVPLWFPNPKQKEAIEFNTKLTEAVIARRMDYKYNPAEFLGHSFFAAEDNQEPMVSTYAIGSEFWKTLQQQSLEDASLMELLKSKGVDLKSPDASAARLRDEFFRKIKPTLLLRAEYRKDSLGHAKIRSRKNSQLYSGCELLYAVAEGNPRWLIAVLSEMCSKIDGKAVNNSPYRRTATSRPILSRSIQASVIQKASYRYLSFLRNLPGATIKIDNSLEISIERVLRRIAEYFFDNQVRGDFPLDPLGTFVVDEQVPDRLVDLLICAVEQGGVVDVHPDNRELPGTPRKRRYRLSFLLSPVFHLACRNHNPINLSSILLHNFKGQANKQGSLFGDDKT